MISITFHRKDGEILHIFQSDAHVYVALVNPLMCKRIEIKRCDHETHTLIFLCDTKHLDIQVIDNGHLVYKGKANNTVVHDVCFEQCTCILHGYPAVYDSSLQATPVLGADA